MVDLNLKKEFKKQGHWITRFVIEGQAYGGNYDAANDVRLKQFFEHFPDMHTILELGSLEGGHTLRLAQQPGVTRVVGVEGRAANLKKARFVQKLFGIEHIEFIQRNLEKDSLTSLGRFDAVFCSGLLYHLPKPWELLAPMRHLSSNLFLWTLYAAENRANKTVQGFKGLRYRELGFWGHPLSGLSPFSFWPTLAALITMLQQSGFKTVQVIEDDPGHQNGPAVTLAARAGSVSDDFSNRLLQRIDSPLC
jgi:hypothetical protein